MYVLFHKKKILYKVILTYGTFFVLRVGSFPNFFHGVGSRICLKLRINHTKSFEPKIIEYWIRALDQSKSPDVLDPDSQPWTKVEMSFLSRLAALVCEKKTRNQIRFLMLGSGFEFFFGSNPKPVGSQSVVSQRLNPVRLFII